MKVNFQRKLTRFFDRPLDRSPDAANDTSSEVPPEPGEEYFADPLV